MQFSGGGQTGSQFQITNNDTFLTFLTGFQPALDGQVQIFLSSNGTDGDGALLSSVKLTQVSEIPIGPSALLYLSGLIGLCLLRRRKCGKIEDRS